ncbi:hypothetical protein ACCO45_007477 [Purpureocillium lilacinum]|uniref:Uncharacterized protein n=1 Tax=Purpureocillium lilacinum TaxID=33203 RepID=A0ACC4DVE6_PURLI
MLVAWVLAQAFRIPDGRKGLPAVQHGHDFAHAQILDVRARAVVRGRHGNGIGIGALVPPLQNTIPGAKAHISPVHHPIPPHIDPLPSRRRTRNHPHARRQRVHQLGVPVAHLAVAARIARWSDDGHEVAPCAVPQRLEEARALTVLGWRMEDLVPGGELLVRGGVGVGVGYGGEDRVA